MLVARKPSQLRSLLVLARASNLPTVWSNCLAGWLLGGGGEQAKFFWLCLGATFLYSGGMFLNDAFDANFDRQHRRLRPIPSGAIPERHVWCWGFVLLGLGAGALSCMGQTTVILTVLLIVFILLYDAIHKLVPFSPVLMAGCRSLLYLVAASVSEEGITGLAVWCALALGAYIVGLSYLARKETSRGPLQSWPCYFLAVPGVLALLINSGTYLQKALIILLSVVVWILWSLRHIFWKTQRNIGLSISLLIAGIPLLDALAVGGANMSAIFVALFFLALLFQKFIPAT
ncbi:MAG: UbiA family prenyltransferase [Verrucomicrobiota bacterium]